MKLGKPPHLLSTVVAVMAGILIFQGSYIHAKAWLGQWLIASAWKQTLASGANHKPWPWMDSWPVARLSVPGANVKQIVLAGDSGQALAFGPGLRLGSALPGNPGITLISGHRDTHFRFLKDIQRGDKIELRLANGNTSQYLVDELRVVASNTLLKDDPIENTLILATCWPFDNMSANPSQRYLIVAHPTLQKPQQSDPSVI